MPKNKSNFEFNLSRGITFSKHIPKKIPPFERVFDIFKDLLTHTSGNLEETFRWLDILDKEYQIFTDEYSLEQFEEDLKKRGYIKEEFDPVDGAGVKGKGKNI
ncbi:MAG: hypothetical protein P8N54_01630, partial [Flavobacteriales bacterium]|nr:hypothetical protein [Flavobacteriales bacterium]